MTKANRSNRYNANTLTPPGPPGKAVKKLEKAIEQEAKALVSKAKPASTRKSARKPNKATKQRSGMRWLGRAQRSMQGDVLTYTNTEMLGAVAAPPSVFSQLWRVPLNPGALSYFSYASDEARHYEEFMVEDLRIEFVKAAAPLAAAGTLCGYIDNDPTDAVVSSINDVARQSKKFITPITEDYVWDVHPEKRWCYVHMGDSMASDNAEKRQDNPGVLTFFADHFDDSALKGYVLVHYRFRFRQRRESVATALEYFSQIPSNFLLDNTLGTSQAHYPGNLATVRFNDGFDLTNWYLTTPTATNLGSLSFQLAASTVRPEYCGLESTSAVPQIARRPSVVPIFTAGQYLCRINCDITTSTTGGGGSATLQYAYVSDLATGINAGSWTNIGSAVSLAAGGVISIPSASTTALVALTGQAGRYVAFRVLYSIAAPSVLSMENFSVQIQRNAVEPDLLTEERSNMRIFVLPEELSACVSYLSTFTGNVICDPPLPPRQRKLTFDEVCAELRVLRESLSRGDADFVALPMPRTNRIKC